MMTDRVRDGNLVEPAAEEKKKKKIDLFEKRGSPDNELRRDGPVERQ